VLSQEGTKFLGDCWPVSTGFSPLAHGESLVGLNQMRTGSGSVIYNLFPKMSYKEFNESDNSATELFILAVLILLRFQLLNGHFMYAL
jgi:hypothetical protein